MKFSPQLGSPRFRGLATCLIMLLASSVFMQSCKKEYFAMDRVKDNTWNPELAVPLIKSTITVPEVLKRVDDQDVIMVDSTTGLLALRYFSTVFSVSAEEWMELPGLNGSFGHALTAQDVVDITNNGSKTINGSFPIGFAGPNGEDLTEILFKGGTMTLDVGSTTAYNAQVTMTIPGLKIASTSYTSGPLAVSPLGSANTNPNLSGRVLDLDLTGAPSIFVVNYSITYSGAGGAPGQGLNFNLNLGGASSLGGPTYSEIKGDFGQQSINVPLDTIRLRIFDNDNGGIIVWDSALVRGTFTNTYGFPIQADLPVFTVENTETGQTLPVTFPAGVLPMNIPTAFANYDPGTFFFELLGNTNGANVNSVMNLNPNRLIYQGSLTANPGSGPYVNFMRDTSKLALDIDVILPFDGKAMDFSQIDTVDVDIFPLEDDVQEIVSVTLRLTIDNGFPADAFAQIYLLDTTGTVLIDSIFTQTRHQVFESPTPDAFGNVDQTQKVRTRTDIVIDRDKLEKLENAGFGKIILLGWIDSFANGQTRVKIFEHYAMDLWLGLMVEAKFKIEL